jgi:ankyrin repeat protein
LLVHGANVKDPNRPDGRTLLHEVCAHGSALLIPLLIESGADPAARDSFAETPLDLALANNNANAVSTLLKLAETNKSIKRTAEDAMENAAVHGYTDTARLLIQNHFEINNPTPQGSTYLGDAALKAQTRMVQLLLDHGANVTLRNQFGGTALHDAALGGSVEIINLLLNRGANPQLRDNSAHTALDLAKELGNQEIVRILNRP